MNVLSVVNQEKVEDALVDDGIVTKIQLEVLKKEAADARKPLITTLLEQGLLDDEKLTKILAGISNVPYVNLKNTKVDPQILSLLPQDLAEHFMAVPIGEMQNRLVVAMLDADNVQAVDFLSSRIDRPIKVYAASEAGIRKIIGQYKSSGLVGGIRSMLDKDKSAPENAINMMGSNTLVTSGGKESQSQAAAQDSPISQALSGILDYAAKNRASDVHIESLENEIKVRCRVDGVLTEIMRLPKSAEPPLISRIKILSNLKIDEHRTPQDGQFTIKSDGREIDLRIAISPVIWGEQVVIRLLDKSDVNLQLEDMGYNGRSLRSIKKALGMPYGMILTSGPTGSGKTTSMYAMIKAIKSESINIVTLEDPVEYKIDGVNQIQVNANVGLTFATGLRSILRQDPDVVMVGEIRDRETANLAVQAALTGHLVFSTLHTNTASGILPRLLDMGVEPFLIASTVHTVIGQRLIRRVIPGGESYKATPSEVKAIKEALGTLLPKTEKDVEEVSKDLGYSNLPLATQDAYTLIKGKPTPESKTGFKGRLGLYEVFDVTEQIQDLILKRASSSQIQQVAISQGMVTMRQDGYLKALAGITTLIEVNRVASIDA